MQQPQQQGLKLADAALSLRMGWGSSVSPTVSLQCAQWCLYDGFRNQFSIFDIFGTDMGTFYPVFVQPPKEIFSTSLSHIITISVCSEMMYFWLVLRVGGLEGLKHTGHCAVYEMFGGGSALLHNENWSSSGRANEGGQVEASADEEQAFILH